MPIETKSFKKIELLVFENSIFNICDIKDLKLASILKANYDKIKPFIDEIRNTVKPTGRYKEFLDKLSAIGLRDQCQNCGNYSVECPKELNDEYKQDIEEYQKFINECNKKLETETVNIEFDKITMDMIDTEFNDETKNKLDYNTMNMIGFML